MARLLSLAFPPGLFLIATGIVLIGLGTVLDHYGMTRAEWFIGEGGIVSLSLGCLLAVISVTALLLGADPEGAAAGDEGENG